MKFLLQELRSYIVKTELQVSPPTIEQMTLVHYKTVEALSSALRNDLDADRRVYEGMILPTSLNLPAVSAGVFSEVMKRCSTNEIVSKGLLALPSMNCEDATGTSEQTANFAERHASKPSVSRGN